MLTQAYTSTTVPQEQQNLALEELILSCVPYVESLAHGYAQNSYHIEYDDLYSLGMTAVCTWAFRAQAADNPRAYLVRVARSAMADELRRLSRQQKTLSLDAPLSHQSSFCLADRLSDGASPAVSTPSSEMRACAVREALKRLSPHQQEVLQRFYGFAGYSRGTFANIGRDLGISRCTAGSYAAVGRKRLRADTELCKAVGVKKADAESVPVTILQEV